MFVNLCLLPVHVYSLVICALPGKGNWLRYDETQVCHCLCSCALAIILCWHADQMPFVQFVYNCSG